MLHQEGLRVAGPVWCTKIGARLEYNDHMKYGLDACAERIGLRKDDAVERYIKEHKLWEWEQIPGKDKRVKRKFFQKVPPEVIIPYGAKDALVCLALARHQKAEIERLDGSISSTPLPRLSAVAKNEFRLLPVVVRMEEVGVKIDRRYCMLAAQRETEEAQAAAREFRGLTGEEFSDSAKLFGNIFGDEREKWGATEKGNPSFDYDCLRRLAHPAAREILRYRDAKSKSDFYHGFLYHADRNDRIHTSLHQDGTDTGRFSSSDPNLQNMTSEDPYECPKCGATYEDWDDGICPRCEEKLRLREWLVRKAFIPSPGKLFFMPDYSQVEYKLMLDLACRYLNQVTPLAKKVIGGMDFHEATAQNCLEKAGAQIKRKQAKTVNFLDLYGGGEGLLAQELGCTVKQAREIKFALKAAAPEIARLINALQATARTRGFIINWLGRRYDFSRNPNICYTSPNKYIQGGAAEILKLAMVEIAEFLHDLGPGPEMVLQIHDELWFEIPEDMNDNVYRTILTLMEQAYTPYCIPITCSPEWSATNAADKRKGFPCQNPSTE
jgi:DNA polymerase-1